MTELSDYEEDQLRRAMELIGEEAGHSESVEEPIRPIWRRRRVKAVGALAAAAAICAAIVIGNLGGTTGKQAEPHSAEPDRGYTIAQVMACTRIIGVGSIVSMRSVEQSNHALLTLRMEDWIKPANGAKQITINVLDPRSSDTQSWEPGKRMLFYVYRKTDEIASVRGKTLISQKQREYERVVSRPNQPKCPMPKNLPPS